MLRRLLQPKWIIATLAVILLAALFTTLGFWQLNRLDEQRAQNAVGDQQMGEPREDFDELLSWAEADLGAIEYRRVSTAGVFDIHNEVLVRSQVYRGTAGFHVVTPLIKEDASAVLVNRGWVPLTMDDVPVADAIPVPVEGPVEGWIELSQVRPPLGPRDSPEGGLVAVSRIDIDRIEQQLGYPLDPVYLVLEAPSSDDLPVPLSMPEFDEDGPHLAYAIQWFGFALVLLIGYIFFVRKQLGQSG